MTLPQLEHFAASLGVALPVDVTATLGKTLGSGGLGHENTLAPGFSPIELSFAEREPTALRLDAEPPPAAFGTHAPQSVGLGFVDLAGRHAHALQSLLAVAAPLPSFGPYLGLTVGAEGERCRKLYFGVDPAADPPVELARWLADLRQVMPCFRQHFMSVEAGASGLKIRTYLLNHAPVRLLDCVPLLDRWGCPSQKVFAALRRLHEGVLTIPAGRLVLGLRPQGDHVTVKFDLLYDAPHPTAGERWIGALNNQEAWSLWRARLVDAVRPGPVTVGGAGFTVCGEDLDFVTYVRC